LSAVLDALVFWLVTLGLGLLALPLAEALLGRLPGRGLVFARPLGILAAVFPIWLLASLGVVPYGLAGAIGSVVLLVVVAAMLWRRGLGRLPTAGGGRSTWIAGELVFTAAFFGWALLRSFSPDVWQTEKPMDMAIVNAVNRSDSFPPADPWQSGEEVNYYYFGHYLVAFLVRLTAVDPAVGFNVAIALFFALVAAAVFGVAATLWEAARGSGEATERSGIVVGLTAVAFATLVGNVAGGVQFLRDSGGLSSRLETYDWWAPSRVIEGTANEFPYFSFLLADLHAHVMVTPFSLVALAYAIQLGLHGPPRVDRRGGARWRPVVELALASLVLGSLYATNSFDFPTACLVGVGALLVWALGERGRWRRALVWGAAWIGGALLLFLPFWLGFDPPTTSIGRVEEHVPFGRFARDYGYIYGLALWGLIALFASRFKLPRRYFFWAGSALLFLLVLLAPSNLAGLFVALIVTAVAVFVALSSGHLSPPYRMLWLLAAVGLALVASGEVVYLRDAFDGTDSFRFNTVFKTGYQAWFLLAITAGVSVWWSARWLERRVRTLWLVGLAVLVALSLVYPVAASYSKSGRFDASPTLDGMRWLERAAPDDAAAIHWLRTSVDGTPTLLEAVGRDFDPDGRARVSTYTGIPAVMGWAGHEVQWGHDPGSRFADVQQIYSTDDLETARELLEQYHVDYVFVGDLERRDYPAASLAKFRELGSVAFESGATLVYRIERQSDEAEASSDRSTR
jgi:YYY domain-containing protein